MGGGGEVAWQGNVYTGVEITTNNDNPITNFVANKSASKTFEAVIKVPKEEQDSETVWTFTNLPAGLSADGATVSGTATTPENKEVTVTVTKGSYSDTKIFTFAVYGIEISTTSLPSIVYNYNGCSYTATLSIVGNSVAGAITYYASGLPEGLSLNSSTGIISGTPASVGTSTVSIYAKQGEYTSATKNLIINIETPPTPSSSSTPTIKLLASDCRTGGALGGAITILNDSSSSKKYIFTTSNLRYATLVNSTMSKVVLKGDSTQPRPIVNIDITQNQDQIQVVFTLVTQSQLTAASLIKRGPTAISIALRVYLNNKQTKYTSVNLPFDVIMASS